MRFDDITAPVSEADPCGPDLDEQGDEAYLNYVLSAAGRIPESYYQRDPNAPVNESRYIPFDRSKIDLRAEVKAIAGLLGRTKDLRLLTLEARFQCLAGQVVGFCECVQAMAMLVDRYWEEVHPRAADGDVTMRQNTLSGLDDQSSILLPLAYAPLVGSKKIGSVSLRDHLLATKAVQPRPDDRKVELGDVLEALQTEENKGAVVAIDGAVKAALKSLGAMDARFITAVGHESSPSFVNLLKTLGQLQALLHAAVPELAATAEADQEPVEDVAAAETAEGQLAAQPAVPPPPPIALADHSAANEALLAAEQYFARAEPSSPALILIHQARMLVGKSLVEALEMLMPETAGKAIIAFTGGGPPFQLDMSKMKAITKTVTEGVQADGANASNSRFSAETRMEAEQLINSVDTFFRATEPSSPIPMLIGKARTFMHRDFSAILADLIKSDGPPPAA